MLALKTSSNNMAKIEMFPKFMNFKKFTRRYNNDSKKINIKEVILSRINLRKS